MVGKSEQGWEIVLIWVGRFGNPHLPNGGQTHFDYDLPEKNWSKGGFRIPGANQGKLWKQRDF